jgi:hypothetical protein
MGVASGGPIQLTDVEQMAWFNKRSSGDQEEVRTSEQSQPSPDEQLAAAVTQLRAASQRMANDEERARWEAVAEDMAKLERARKFVADTGVGRALCRVLREAWQYPSWSQQADFEKYNKLRAQNISGSEGKEGNHDVKR